MPDDSHPDPEDSPATASDGRTGTGFVARLFEPVDAASINLFRIMFGLVMFWEVWRYFDAGWIRTHFIVRDFYFKYYGFEWVQPWPGDWMYVHFAVMGLLALCIAFGFLYRVAAWLFFLGFSYWFLLDQTRYLNHLYLVVLISFLMAVIPAHRAKSVDARLWPDRRSQTLPKWCLWLLQIQIGLVYFYAGVAKLNADWLNGDPLRNWLAKRGDYPLIGDFLQSEAAAWLFSYGGLGLDLFVAPLLLWPRTRALAFASCVFFHVSNKILFNIGIFPVMALGATTLLFAPDWPRRVHALFGPRVPGDAQPLLAPQGWRRRAVVAGLAAYVALQVLMPLRHFLYPGDVHWTEEGHRFAWHMKLRDKKADAQFFVTDPRTGLTWEVDERRWLSSAQTSRVGRWPDMTLQFAHFLSEELREEGGPPLEVRVRSTARLNSHPEQLLFDPDVDLAKEPRNLWHADWILPLRER